MNKSAQRGGETPTYLTNRRITGFDSRRRANGCGGLVAAVASIGLNDVVRVHSALQVRNGLDTK